jgi:hypothetical protein
MREDEAQAVLRDAFTGSFETPPATSAAGKLKGRTKH